MSRTFTSSIRDLLFDQLHRKKRFPGLMTPKQEVLKLIRSLRPWYTNRELIRMGPEKDGGYLIPNDLVDVNLLISPGVDQESRFEWECAEKGMEVHLLDASVSGPAVHHPRFHFHPVFMGIGEKEWSLEDLVHAQQLDQQSGDWMLQMDIEGAEWETLIQMPPTIQNRFRIMVIEFHDMDNLFNLPFFRVAQKVFEKLLRTHTVVHVHPNNYHPMNAVLGIEIPKYMEFTFLRKDRIHHAHPASVFPHPLDRPCTERQDVALPQIWYKGEKANP
jgi:hypothetical protein